MIFKKIWERYFFKELLKVFFLFIASFCFLYILIDYSVHSKAFTNFNVSWFEFFSYYSFHLIKRAEILLSFALLLSTVKVLCSLHQNNELVALMTSGVPIKSLLRPFFFLAMLCSCFLLLNFEYLSPYALPALEDFKTNRLEEKAQNTQGKKIQVMPLIDNSTLIYQNYDPTMQAFFDVYWIASNTEVFHMKYLYPKISNPFGRNVDHFHRNDEDIVVLKNSEKHRSFPSMRFDEELLLAALQSPEQQSLSQLWYYLPLGKTSYTDKEAQIMTAFSYKMLIPLVFLLCVIGPAPFCMQFTRNLRIFMISSASIFSLLSFFTMLDAAQVLGVNQVLPPLLSVGTPFLIFYSFASFFFIRMR